MAFFTALLRFLFSPFRRLFGGSGPRTIEKSGAGAVARKAGDG